jgi:predicted nucleic acid-binding protein
MQRVTLDKNVYVSALNFGGKPAQMLGMAQAGTIRIDISDAIMAELMRVLREDFAWDGYRLHFMQQRLLEITNRVQPKHTLKVIDDPRRRQNTGMCGRSGVGVHRNER